MKALGVYYCCAKAEFVTLFGPRAVGPSPHEQRGMFLCYTIEGRNTSKNDKIDQNNDKIDVWDGLLD